MNETESAVYLSAIHQLLLAHFDEEELKTLCLSLGLTYDDLPANGRTNKARELVTHLNRRDRLGELRTAVTAVRPNAVWPIAKPVAPQPQAAASARWQLAAADRAHLIDLLVARQEFRTEERRDAFIEEMLAGSPRKGHIQGQISLSGPPRQFAGHLLTVLTQFGQDEPGQEVLGLLLNHLLTYVGATGPDADFLRGLFARYPLKTKPISTRDMPAWRGHESPTAVQEKIIGENTLRDVRLLELALDAARAVVRIVTADSLGSGFLVGSGLIMTNHHVIGSREAAQPCAFQFHYQLDKQFHPLPILAARAKPDGLFYTNPDLDVTVVEVLDAPTDIAPLTLARLRVAKDSRVNIIQHPGGHYKKISMQNNFVAFADGRHLQYLTSTEPGSSGSPVFNNDFLVIGIHHSGGLLPEPGSEQTYLRNAGSSMIAVLDDLRDHAPEIYQRLQYQ